MGAGSSALVGGALENRERYSTCEGDAGSLACPLCLGEGFCYAHMQYTRAESSGDLTEEEEQEMEQEMAQKIHARLVELGYRS